MRLLKKYPNRRIYDTEDSRFITLSDVREMVLRHEDFQVLDSKTGNDLTRTTLLQIIADLESEGHASVLTNKILEDLIRFYGDAMGGVLGTLIERSIAAERMGTVSYGESRPAVLGKNEAAWRQNRRTVLVVLSGDHVLGVGGSYCGER